MNSSNNKFFILLTSLFISFFAWTMIAKIDITFNAPGSVMPETNFTIEFSMKRTTFLSVIRKLHAYNPALEK